MIENAFWHTKFQCSFVKPFLTINPVVNKTKCTGKNITFLYSTCSIRFFLFWCAKWYPWILQSDYITPGVVQKLITTVLKSSTKHNLVWYRVYSKIRTIELLNFGKWCLEKGSLAHYRKNTGQNIVWTNIWWNIT